MLLSLMVVVVAVVTALCCCCCCCCSGVLLLVLALARLAIWEGQCKLGPAGVSLPGPTWLSCWFRLGSVLRVGMQGRVGGLAGVDGKGRWAVSMVDNNGCGGCLSTATDCVLYSVICWQRMAGRQYWHDTHRTGGNWPYSGQARNLLALGPWPW